MTPELMTVGDFLKRYSISHSEFYRQVAAKRIRVTKIGRATRVAKADADIWLATLPTSGEEVRSAG
jgi:hypothetical protein